jgi:hypothetical protein
MMAVMVLPGLLEGCAIDAAASARGSLAKPVSRRNMRSRACTMRYRDNIADY